MEDRSAGAGRAAYETARRAPGPISSGAGSPAARGAMPGLLGHGLLGLDPPAVRDEPREEHAAHGIPLAVQPVPLGAERARGGVLVHQRADRAALHVVHAQRHAARVVERVLERRARAGPARDEAQRRTAGRLLRERRSVLGGAFGHAVVVVIVAATPLAPALHVVLVVAGILGWADVGKARQERHVVVVHAVSELVVGRDVE